MIPSNLEMKATNAMCEKTDFSKLYCTVTPTYFATVYIVAVVYEIYAAGQKNLAVHTKESTNFFKDISVHIFEGNLFPAKAMLQTIGLLYRILH